MNDLTIQAITNFGTFPLAYLILRLIFKKSIMFTFSLYVVGFVFIVSYTKFVEGYLQGMSALWITPINFAIGTIMFIIINKLLRKPLENSIKQVQELSKGNLNVQVVKSDSKNELGILNNSLESLVETFQNIITQINSGAQNLVSSGEQLSSSSEQMSQGANEQASSIEEISSTMEEITANIIQNTENSKITEQVSIEANIGIKLVVEQSEKAIAANKSIAEKITIINDIAFQTNILALNAAVEAARAGEHGKGFAVVAAEVRKLAERSKLAADEIVNLAKASHELAINAGNVMSDTIPKIEQTTKLVQEISAASSEQSNGASQVNNAIQQLNNLTQQNASSSEELAGSAEELSAQAEQLQDLISFFRADYQNERVAKNSFKLKNKSKTNNNNKKVNGGFHISMPSNVKEDLFESY